MGQKRSPSFRNWAERPINERLEASGEKWLNRRELEREIADRRACRQPMDLAHLAGRRDMNITKLFVYQQNQTVSRGDGSGARVES